MAFLLLFISSSVLLKFQMLYFFMSRSFIQIFKSVFHVCSRCVSGCLHFLECMEHVDNSYLNILPANSIFPVFVPVDGFLSLLWVTLSCFCICVDFCLGAGCFLLNAEFHFIPLESVGLFLAGI